MKITRMLSAKYDSGSIGQMFYLLIVLVVPVVLLGCTSNPTETASLKLTWEHGPQFLGFYAAAERGYYAEEGLEVQIEPLFEPRENAGIPARVAAGEFDFSVAARPVLAAQADGVPVTTIALIGQLSPLAFFARADSGIETPADMAGKRVAIASEVSRQTLQRLLAQEALTLEDVETVEVGFDLTPFYEEEVDVWIGYLNDEAIQVRQEGIDLVTFPLFEYGILFTTPAIYTSKEVVENEPDYATRFLRASLRGWEWAIENPTEAVDLMIARYPEMAPDRDFYLTSFDAYIPLVRPPGVRLGSLDCQKWVEDPLLAELETTEGLCTTALLEAAQGNE